MVVEGAKEKPTETKSVPADKMTSEQKSASDSLRELFQKVQQGTKPENSDAAGGKPELPRPAESPTERMAAAQRNAADSLRMDLGGKISSTAEVAQPSKDAAKLLGDVAISGADTTMAKPQDNEAAKEKAEATAVSIERACNGGILLGAGTDHKAIIKALEGTTEAERTLIKDAFKQKFGHTLEEEFADEMDKDSPEYASVMGVLNRKDNSTGEAARIDAALKERSQWVMGRANKAIEQDVIDTVSTMNSKQIQTMKEEFIANPENAKKYPGGIEQAVRDSDLSDSTKKAFAVFMKGNDLRTVDDVRNLVDIATTNGNLQLLEQTMRGSPKDIRDQLAGDPRVQASLERGFGRPIYNEVTGDVSYMSTTDLEQARSYLQEGRLGLSDSVKNSTSALGDNEAAIEAAIKIMSESERQSYLRGRTMAETGKVPEGFTARDKQTYDQIQTAFRNAGDEHEVLRWDAMVEHPKGSLVETLSRHKGTFKDSSTDTVMKDLESMSADEWKRIKEDPRYFEQVRKTLATFADGKERNADGSFANTEMGTLSKMLHTMRDASSSTEAVAAGGRNLHDRIDDKRGWNNDEEGIFNELEKMSPAEQQKLRDNPAEAQRVRELLIKSLDQGAERDAGLGMLDNVMAGRSPKGLLERINVEGAKTNTKEDVVIRDFRQALKDDSALLDRIRTDSAFKEKLTTALTNALDPDEFQRYAKPLLETGTLPIEVQMELNRGVDDNEVAAVKDILFATPAEKQRILEDNAYRQTVMGFLSKDEQAVALNVLRQGEMRPEDEVEIQMLGAGTGEEEIKAVLKKLNPQQKNDLQVAYYEKYGKARGEDLRSALLTEMGGKDRLDVLRELEAPAATAREEFNRRRSEYYDMRGVGESWVDAAWDGTADDARARVNEFAASVSNASAEYNDLPPEMRKQLSDAVVDGLERLSDSQGAVADAAADAVITIGALAAAKFTGGVSLSLLTYTSFGGALMRVGAHSALNSRFELLSAEGATQLGAGALDGLFSVAGGVELSKVMALGKRAAEESAELTAKQLVKEGAAVLAEGSEQRLKETLAKNTTELVSEALATGSGVVDDKAIAGLAQSLVRQDLTGEAGELAVGQISAMISSNLQSAIVSETRQTMRQAFREISLNAAGGNMGATASAIPRALLDFDPEHPEQFFYAVGASAVIGTVSGGGFTGLTKLAGHTVERLTGRTAAEADDIASRASRDVPQGGRSHVEETSAPKPPETGEPKRHVVPVPETRVAADAADQTVLRAADNVRVRETLQPAEARARAHVDVDGRPLGTDGVNPHRQKVAEAFAPLNNGDIEAGVNRLRRSADDLKAGRQPGELEVVRAVGIDGKPTSVYDSLMSDPHLSAEQKDRLLRNLAEVREHFARYRAGDRMHADPEVNWIHTMGEFGKVLESGRANKLSAEELEDALLASMYSDSYKFAFPPPKGAEANFWTHHLDGALAAHESLSRQGLPPERMERILKAIHEHQIAPPQFMGQLYHLKMKMALDGMQKTLPPEEYARKLKILEEMTIKGPDGINRIGKLANVNEAPKLKGPSGDWEVDFTPDEREMLKLAGVERWSVPVDPKLDSDFARMTKEQQEKLLSSYRISQALIDGDGIDNYATMGGASKIVAIRGPETNFRDNTVWQSIDSVDNSFKDAYNVLSPEGKRLADASLADRNAKLKDQSAGVRAQMDVWLRGKGLDPTKEIPYYNSTLEYPKSLTLEENDALKALNQKLAGDLSPDERTQATAAVRALKYKGLSEKQIADYEFAKEIRSQMVDMMRRAHRTDGSLPGNYEPVRGTTVP